MWIAKKSVKLGVTTAMLYLMAVGFGMFSLMRLQLDLYPDISFPTVIVITNYTGASPEDIETLISSPIEGAVASVKDVKEVRSTSKQGASLVMVEFDWSKDMEQAETHVRRAIEMIEQFLPTEADKPMIFAFDPSLQPIVMMMLTGPYPLDQLRKIADEEIKPRLERLDGIASAEAMGGLEREIHVVLDPQKVEAFGLDPSAIAGAVFQENMQEPGGSLEQGTLDFTIQVRSKYQRVSDIGEVVVSAKPTPNGLQQIKLKEVATISDAFFESQHKLEVDNEPTVWLMVRKQSGANTVRSAESVIAALPAIKKASGGEIDFKVIFDQSEFVKLSLGNLSSTGMLGVLLTFLVLYYFLRNIRSSLIVTAVIPISVVVTFAVMDQSDMTLNILSMAGLALAIGMLVDNAIVVLENIFRLRQEGHTSISAAVHGTETVGMAVTASTLTTVVVFVPVLFVPGIAGVMFKDMSVTICFSLLVSLLVAMSFVPFAFSRLLSSNRADRLLKRAFERDPLKNFTAWYGRLLDWLLDHRWVVFTSLLGTLIVTVALLFILPMEFIMAGDQSQVFVSIETPIGTNLDESYKVIREAADKVEAIVKPEERRMVALDVGMGKGFTSLFSKGVHAGIIRVPLVPISQRKRSQAQIEEAIRKELSSMPGVKVSVTPPFNPLGGEGDIEIQIRGHDLDESRRVGLDIRDKLRAWPEMSEVNFSMTDQKPEIRVQLDRPKIAQLGLSSASISRSISSFFKGRTIGRYSEGGDEFDIVLRYPKEYRVNIDELKRMPIATRQGQTIPLSNVANIDIALGPVDISRSDQTRFTTINCTLSNTYTDDQAQIQRKDLRRSIENVDKMLGSYTWPKEFSYYIGGTAEDFMTSFQYLALALLVSILLVYMVMASQFESLREPFIILFTVPMAGIGVVLMFVLTQSPVDMTAIIGAIMLVGIVVNNGIVMVDAANQLRIEGLDRKQAIAKAARIRLRPVLMTTLTTILGMLPLAFQIGEGSEGWVGLAKSVIGGLGASTLLTLLFVPTLYTLIAPKNLKRVQEEVEPNHVAGVTQ